MLKTENAIWCVWCALRYKLICLAFLRDSMLNYVYTIVRSLFWKWKLIIYKYIYIYIWKIENGKWPCTRARARVPKNNKGCGIGPLTTTGRTGVRAASMPLGLLLRPSNLMLRSVLPRDRPNEVCVSPQTCCLSPAAIARVDWSSGHLIVSKCGRPTSISADVVQTPKTPSHVVASLPQQT